MKTAKHITAAIVFALLISGHAGEAQLADIDTPLVEAAPAYSSSEARTAHVEVLPVVEELTGRKLKQVPPIRLVTRKQFMAETRRDQQTRQQSRSGRQRETTPQPRQETYVDYAFGAYEPGNGAVYLFPGNFRPRLERAGVPRNYERAMLKMIVAHELTHALQHQEVWSARSKERGRARRSARSYSPKVIRTLTEGHATFIMDEVADKLGFPDAIPQFHKTISVGLVAYTDPKHREANEDLREKTRSFYLDGKRFIGWHYERGGTEQVWRVIKNPPRDWSEIENVVRSSKL